jgi:Flp pilus assembly pilin Flp
MFIQRQPGPSAAWLLRRRQQHGSALIEYTIVLLLLVVALLADPNVIRQLADAVRDAYTSFVYALSISWI